MRLIKESPPLLKGGGWLCFEVGLGQGLAMAQRLQRNPLYTNVKPIVDSNGEIRVVAAQAKG
jgi:release factor glutamine methyltransferase